MTIAVLSPTFAEIELPDLLPDDWPQSPIVAGDSGDDFDDPRDESPVEKRVCPFTVIVDTREQAPYHFLNIDPFSIVPIVTDKSLETGDYSIQGLESRVTIERKSTSDFLGSISAGRERFEREFERMAKMDSAFVVVEEEMSAVFRHAQQNTQLSTKSILGTINAWEIRYGVHFRFCQSRRSAEIQTFFLLHTFWKQEQKRIKDASKLAAIEHDSSRSTSVFF